MAGQPRWQAAAELAGCTSAAPRLQVAVRAVPPGRAVGQSSQPRAARGDASGVRLPAGPVARGWPDGYLVVVGPITEAGNVNTPFEPSRGAEIREFIDGTSNTVLVLETDHLVPWTKPDDLRWERDGPLPRLASPHSGGTNALFADGSTTRFLKPAIQPNVLVALLTINGNEVLSDG